MLNQLHLLRQRMTIHILMSTIVLKKMVYVNDMCTVVYMVIARDSYASIRFFELITNQYFYFTNYFGKLLESKCTTLSTTLT